MHGSAMQWQVSGVAEMLPQDAAAVVGGGTCSATQHAAACAAGHMVGSGLKALSGYAKACWNFIKSEQGSGIGFDWSKHK